MVKFRQVELFLDGTYAEEERKEFMLKSRCICGYLERGLAQSDFESTRSRVNIFCSKEHIDGEAKDLKDPPFVEVRMHFDASAFFGSDFEKKQQIYIKVIELGLAIAEEIMPIPLELCTERLMEFSSNGYVNEWVHHQKEWKKCGVKCIFRCVLKEDEFCQTQEIYVDGKMIIYELISRTMPREFLFHQFLGRAALKNGNEIQYKTSKRIISMYKIKDGVLTFAPENISEH